jgi:hypothetical protein
VTPSSEVPGPRNTSGYASYISNQCNKSLALLVLHWVAARRRGVPKVHLNTADSACYVPNWVNKSLALLALHWVAVQLPMFPNSNVDIVPGVQISRSQATTCSTITHLAHAYKLLRHRSY